MMKWASVNARLRFICFHERMWINLYIAVMTADVQSYITQGGFSSVRKGNRFLLYLILNSTKSTLILKYRNLITAMLEL